MEGGNVRGQPQDIQKIHTLKSSSSDFGDDDLDDDLLALVGSSTSPTMNSANESDAIINKNAPQHFLVEGESNQASILKNDQALMKDDNDDEFDDDVEFGESMEQLLTQYEKEVPAIQKQALPQPSRNLSHEQPMMKFHPQMITRDSCISDKSLFSDDEFEDNDLDLDNVLQELEHQSEVGFP